MKATSKYLTHSKDYYLYFDNPTKHMAFFDKVLKLDPKNAELYLFKSNLLLHLNKPQEALVYIEAAIKLESRNANNYFMKASILASLNHIQEAQDIYNIGIELIETINAFDDYIQGKAAYNLGKNKDAIHCFDMALILHDKFPIASLGKASSLLNMKQYKEAIKCIDETLETNKEVSTHTKAKLIFAKGKALYALEDYKGANDCIEIAICTNPNDSDIWYHKGLCLYKLEQYKEASEYFDSYANLYPDNNNSIYYKGMTLSKLGQHKEALPYLEKSMEINDNDPLLYIEKGKCHLKLNQGFLGIQSYLDGTEKFLSSHSSTALIFCDLILEILPKNINTLFNKANILYAKGNWDLSLEIYQKIVEIDKSILDAHVGIINSYNKEGLQFESSMYILENQNMAIQVRNILADIYDINLTDNIIMPYLGFDTPPHVYIGDIELAGLTMSDIQIHYDDINSNSE